MLGLREPDRADAARLPVSDPRGRVQIRLIDGLGRTERLPPAGRARGFSATTRWAAIDTPSGFHHAFDVEISLISRDEQPRGLGIQVAVPLDGPATRFMVPGVLYGQNRLAACTVRYPRFDEAADSTDALTADHWSFRADRASHSLVIGWSETECVALATDEASVLGQGGLGLHGGMDPEILLNFPAREEPVTYAGHAAPGPPEILLHRWRAGEIATLHFTMFIGDPDPHGYDALLRATYARDRARHDLQPWMPTPEAAALTAHGLYRWHYRPEDQTLAEATAFERPGAELTATVPDGNAMHAVWVNGAPSGYALLTYARNEGIGEYAAAAVAVLDKIAGSVAPCGLFWGRPSQLARDGGWNGHSDWIHARPVAEATLFMVRALAFEEAQGIEHPSWKEAIITNLRGALASQQGGAFPCYVNGRTGQPEGWEGAAGLLWIPALIEGAAHLEGVDVKVAAGDAGSYYAEFVDDEFIYGALEDVPLAPSSEDAYNAVMAYVALFEATREDRWSDLATRAADWMMSFRWSYNLAFPTHTILQSYDFRSRGADVASPATQYLHGSGLICLPEMLRLAEHTGDSYYLDRTRDNLACFLQFIAREDGDFNARMGMVSDRYYNTRGFGPKGAILPISHARSVGLALYASQAGLTVDP
ncbi:MAG TPA: hypothetical protein VIN39_12335 [Candidatus Dormibacteraeota bacterium]|jgi:hypothetical protein